MGASAALSATSQGVNAISTIGSAYSNSQAQKAQAEYQEGIAKVNSMFTEVAAEDAITRGEFLASEVSRRGDQQVSLIRRKASTLEGAQKSSYAAQGVDPNSGSAAEVEAESKFMAQRDVDITKRNTATDVLTIKNNAWREAWGLKAQEISNNLQGTMAGIAGSFASKQTLLTGGLNALSYGLRAGSALKGGAPVYKGGSGSSGSGTDISGDFDTADAEAA